MMLEAEHFSKGVTVSRVTWWPLTGADCLWIS